MRLIKIKEVIKMTSLSRATIYKYMADDSFPKPVSLGTKAVAWVEDEVENWIVEKIEAR
ncbi:phage transcriptional regulator AlpA [Alteromonas macleodii str. 'Black Sea 11']|nr:AlpA family transcriptional regulator [Alteromonas macleodii]AFT78505.1 phage transcriptional regulator AlpA [Alteromonas macleodii str. 'Black Sea 11']|tara:strand:- start:18518 stop:18694 length:177 start_codon:yes stop_codon:yes gene_type:complete